MRYTVGDLAQASGFCRKTIRLYADKGLLSSTRDHNNYRVFTENAVKKARQMAGVNSKEKDGDNDGVL